MGGIDSALEAAAAGNMLPVVGQLASDIGRCACCGEFCGAASVFVQEGEEVESEHDAAAWGRD